MLLRIKRKSADKQPKKGAYTLKNIAGRIKKLKREKNAVILAHLYQKPEVQDIADFVGDSLELSRQAKTTDADVILFCGVNFMAETAKILSPEKTVLLSEKSATCPMADMITVKDLIGLKNENKNAAVVCYVNSGAEIKAMSDICCTSSNAVKVVRSLKENEVIFIPDKNLGHYVSRFTPEKKIILFEGYCPVHHHITTGEVIRAKEAHKNALLLVHPECTPEVIDSSGFTGSTSQIIEYACKSKNDEFIIGTESGILHRLKKLCPGKKFYTIGGGMVCPDMKKTTPESVLSALENMDNRVELDEEIIAKASASLEKMLSLQEERQWN